MLRKIILALLMLLCCSSGALALSDQVEVASPCLSPDGQTVYFSAWGDIWASDRSGTEPARRLSNSVAEDDLPVLSPDGQWLAFASDRHGSTNIYVMPAAGGSPRRLTWSSESEIPCAWSPDGSRILFSSSQDQTWTPTLFEVDLEGGEPRQLGGPDHLERINACYAGSGDTLIMQRGIGDWWRRNYRGSYTYDIFAYDRGSHELSQLTDFEGLDAWPQCSPDGRYVYYVSDRRGSRNIYRIDRQGGPEKQISDFNGNGPTSLRMRADGREIACEAFGELWIVSTDGSGKQRVPVQIADDPKREWLLNYDESRFSDFRISPNGNYFLLEVEGDLHILKNPDAYKDDEKPDQDLSRTHHITVDPGWERQFSWHPDGTKFVYVSDRSGQNDLYLYDLTTNSEERLTTSIEPEWYPLFAPKGERILFLRGNTELRVLDLERETDKLVYEGNMKRNDWVAGYSWAPDGYWLSFSSHQGNLFFDVHLANVEDLQAIDISQTPDSAVGPVFSRDGKWLAWSQRSQVFDESNAMLLRLVPEGPDYNDELLFPEDKAAAEADADADEEAGEEDAAAAADDADADSDDAEADDEAADDDSENDDEDKEEDEDVIEPYDPIEIDFERIHERYFAVGGQFVYSGAEIFDFDSKYLFFTAGGPGGDGLWAYKLDGGEESQVDGGFFGGGLQYGKDGKRLYYSGRGISYLELAGAGKRGQGSVPVTAKVSYEQRARWNEVLQDAWRQIGYNFYDSGMHETDWKAVLPKYQKRLKGIGTTREFNRLLTEMVGEINASHTWAFVPNLEGSAGPGDNTGFLGVDYQSSWPGPGWWVSRVLRDGPADEPGHELYPGDVILSIDGHAIQPADNRAMLLRNRAGEIVRLRVKSGPAALAAEAEAQAKADAKAAIAEANAPKHDKADKKDDKAPKDNNTGQLNVTGENGERELLLKLTGHEGQLRYQQWTDERLAEVQQLSEGRIAYVHLPGMNMWQYNKLFREIFGPQKNCDALIIDARFNNGGNIHNELAELFSRQMFATVNPRGGPFSKEPAFTWERPVVMLINRRSYSDGEIVPHVFKQLGLATIMGEPTGGNVIRAGGVNLMDGSGIATPADGFYMSTGLNTERNGVEPDIAVEIDPGKLEEGHDSQIEAAVKYLLEKIR
jgi:Tol biopolymer transport system component/C-terminal processing protease CtpA/Prc